MSNSKTILEASSIAQAADLDIFDYTGQKVRFGSLFENKKVIVVFIRHFFCGSCQAYVEQLAKVNHEVLDEARVDVSVVGCGDWDAIKAYAETTGFSGPIYADPSRVLYRALGMTIETIKTTPAGEQKRSYITRSMFSNVIQSIWRGPLQHPSLIGKQGNISQLGGEFIFGPGIHCSFVSRMQHTEDHVEVSELMKEAGVAYH